MVQRVLRYLSLSFPSCEHLTEPWYIAPNPFCFKGALSLYCVQNNYKLIRMANASYQVLTVSQKLFQVLHMYQLISPHRITLSIREILLLLAPISQMSILRHREGSKLAQCYTSEQ